MSPLALIKARILRGERLKAAQMAHVMSKSYRGIDTTNPKPFPVQRDQKVLTYRGTTYLG